MPLSSWWSAFKGAWYLNRMGPCDVTGSYAVPESVLFAVRLLFCVYIWFIVLYGFVLGVVVGRVPGRWAIFYTNWNFYLMGADLGLACVVSWFEFRNRLLRQRGGGSLSFKDMLLLPVLAERRGAALHASRAARLDAHRALHGAPCCGSCLRHYDGQGKQGEEDCEDWRVGRSPHFVRATYVSLLLHPVAIVQSVFLTLVFWVLLAPVLDPALTFGVESVSKHGINALYGLLELGLSAYAIPWISYLSQFLWGGIYTIFVHIRAPFATDNGEEFPYVYGFLDTRNASWPVFYFGIPFGMFCIFAPLLALSRLRDFLADRALPFDPVASPPTPAEAAAGSKKNRSRDEEAREQRDDSDDDDESDGETDDMGDDDDDGSDSSEQGGSSSSADTESDEASGKGSSSSTSSATTADTSSDSSDSDRSASSSSSLSESSSESSFVSSSA